MNRVDAVKLLREAIYQIDAQADEAFWESTALRKDAYLQQIRKLCADALANSLGGL